MNIAIAQAGIAISGIAVLRYSLEIDRLEDKSEYDHRAWIRILPQAGLWILLGCLIATTIWYGKIMVDTDSFGSLKKFPLILIWFAAAYMLMHLLPKAIFAWQDLDDAHFTLQFSGESQFFVEANTRFHEIAFWEIVCIVVVIVGWMNHIPA